MARRIVLRAVILSCAMSLSVLDDILKTAPAEDQIVLDKYPQLRASMERLENDLKTLAPFAQYGMDMQDWRQQNWDEESNMTKAEKALTEELATVHAQLMAAEATRSIRQTAIIWASVLLLVATVLYPPGLRRHARSWLRRGVSLVLRFTRRQVLCG
jgi:hypothetical protein